jgi:hypothetical protein
MRMSRMMVHADEQVSLLVRGVIGWLSLAQRIVGDQGKPTRLRIFLMHDPSVGELRSTPSIQRFDPKRSRIGSTANTALHVPPSLQPVNES